MAIFSYSTVAQIKVDCSGNVGININPSSYKFDVNGTSIFRGNVGIAGYSTSYKLKVYGNTWLEGNLDLGYLSYPKPFIKIYTTTIKAILEDLPQYNVGYLGTSSDQWGYIYGESIWADGEYLGSDLRLKENIRNLDNSLEKIELLRPVKFDFKPDPVPDLPELREYIINKNNLRKNRIGFIAQEVLNVIPDIVEYDTAGDRYYIDYNAIIPYLVEAIKEQQTMIENLNNEISALKSESSDNLKSALITNDDNLVEQTDKPILFQNKPNPFNEDTEIKFYLPATINDARIYLYNMQGNQIKSMFINQRDQGNEIIHGSELQPGMYMYTLIVDGLEVDTKRMILTD